MKIAVFLYHFPVLSETFILNQITGLIDRGHHVTIFCMTPFSDNIRHLDIERYNLINRTLYYGIRDDRLPRNKFWRLTKAAHYIFSHINTNPLPLLKSLNLFKYGREAISLGIFYLVLPFLENNLYEYDIAHCHYGPNGDLAVTLKDLGAFKGRIVTTFHGEAGYTKEKRLRSKKACVNRGYETLLQIGDLFLPMSETEKQDLIHLGCDPKKIIVHRMGVDTKKFVPTAQKFRPSNKIRLLTVGRLVEKKGIEYGIRCVAKVAKKYRHIEYNIVGDGPLRDNLQQLVYDLDMVHNVRILGSKRQEEVLALMRNTDLLLAPSVGSQDGDREGVPISIMEAMALGLPVLSTQHAGIPELVQDGISGFLVPERDTNALSEKLGYLVEHQELWAKMGAAGTKFVEKYFEINKLNDQLVQLFQQLLDQN